MRFLALILCLCLFAPGAHAIEINRNVDAVPEATVPPPDGAPPLPTGPDAPTSLPHLKPLAPGANNATPAAPAKLSADDLNDVARIEAYLNELKSISADFLQIDDQGNIMRGSIEIQRPGKMRVNYAPPSHDFIVADGDMVHMWDGSLKSQTNVPQSSSLADFILRDPIKLGGDVTITKFERFPSKLELTLMQTKDPGLGQLTLVFEDHPLLLRQWRVVDAQGRTTGVNLENEHMDVKFDRSIFNFLPPDFGKGGKAQ
jgi:outer membrane lipoprotein-sorting protein